MKLKLTQVQQTPLNVVENWDDSLSKKGFKSKEVACFSFRNYEATYLISPAKPGIVDADQPYLSKPNRAIFTDGKRFFSLVRESADVKIFVEFKSKKLNNNKIWLIPKAYWVDLPDELEVLYGVEDDIDVDLEESND